MLAEMKENDAISFLTPLSESAFGYALANGTVGVYDKNRRLWRIKVSSIEVKVFFPDEKQRKQL